MASSRPIRALVPLEPPWLFETSRFPHLSQLASLHGRQRDQYPQYLGIVKEIISTIARRANVAYELITVPRSLPSEKLANGTWTGMIGRLQRNEVDIIAQSYLATPELMDEGFSFAPPLEFGPLYAVFRRRQEGEVELDQNGNNVTTPTSTQQQIINVWGILKPLSVNAWLVFVACMIFCVVFGAWLEFYEQQLCVARPRKFFRRRHSSTVQTVKVARVQMYDEALHRQPKLAWSAEDAGVPAKRKKRKEILPDFEDDQIGGEKGEKKKRNSVIDPRYKWKLGNGDRKGWPYHGIMLNYGETMLRILVQRDTSYEPVQSAASIFLTFWTNFTIIFMAVYAANLFSTYTVAPPVAVPFHDFASLREAGYRVVVGQRGDYSARVVSEILRQANGTLDAQALEASLVVLEDDPQGSLSTIQNIFASIKRKNSRQVALMPLAFINNEQGFDCELQALPITYQILTSSSTSEAPLFSASTSNAGGVANHSATNDAELPTVQTSFMLRSNDKYMRRLIEQQLWWLRKSGLFSAIKGQQAKLWNSFRRGAKNHMQPCDAFKTEAPVVATTAQQLTLRQLASSFLLTIAGGTVGFFCYLAERCLDRKEKV